MPTKKNAQNKKAPAKKAAAKKTVAKKTSAKKTPIAKKAVAKKAASPKAAPKQTGARKKAEKPAAKASNTEKTAPASRPKASDFVKRPSHTPAIFKPASKRPIHILFTIEDVRELLKRRSKEEKLLRASEQAKNGQNNHESKGGPVVIDEATPRTSKHHAATLDDILGISAPAAQKSAAGKVPRKFQKYYKLLIELRDHVREELNLHSNDTLKRSQKEDAGDISISVDAGTDNFDRDFALSLLSTEQESLKEIEAAIQRIHDGTYGVCEVTGEPINEERLEAVPFTRFSLDGQRQYEMTARKRVTRTGAFLNEASGETISFGDDDGDN